MSFKMNLKEVSPKKITFAKQKLVLKEVKQDYEITNFKCRKF